MWSCYLYIFDFVTKLLWKWVLTRECSNWSVGWWTAGSRTSMSNSFIEFWSFLQFKKFGKLSEVKGDIWIVGILWNKQISSVWECWHFIIAVVCGLGYFAVGWGLYGSTLYICLLNNMRDQILSANCNINSPLLMTTHANAWRSSGHGLQSLCQASIILSYLLGPHTYTSLAGQQLFYPFPSLPSMAQSVYVL